MVTSKIRPSEDLVKDLWNVINKRHNSHFDVRVEDRQLTIVNYRGPEKLVDGICELNDLEKGISRGVISKEINSKEPWIGRTFELLAFHG